MSRYWFLSVLILIATLVSSYFVIDPESHDTALSVIHVGILPDQSKETLHQRYDPLLEYLSADTGIEFELVIPQSYIELVRMFVNDEVEMAKFGGLTFVQANALSNAQPLVMRDVDTRFTSLFVVRKDHPAHILADIKGKFSFGNRISTSGHLMPRHFMSTELHIVPEKVFREVKYSGAHDRTVYQVRDGKVDAGVVNAEVFRAMIKDGRVKSSDLRVIWQTPPFPDYVWAVQDHIDEATLIKLRDAFLKLDVDDAVHSGILDRVGAVVYYPAGVVEFTPLKKTAESMGLLE